MIHDQNCTRCRHRKTYKKAIDGKYELELCGLTRSKIPAPNMPGRYCDHFQQEGCSCERCNIVPSGTTY